MSDEQDPAVKTRTHGAAPLAALHKILTNCTLDLGRSKLTDTGVKELARFKNLISLNLWYTEVTDAGVRELAALKNLTKINLIGTKATNAGVKEIQKALPKCEISK